MTKSLSMLALVFLVGCNPASRCKASTECGAGVCSGGFCTDLSGILSSGDGGERGDVDDVTGAPAPDAGAPDYDAGNDGRP